MKPIAILPSLLTLGNTFCGFAAICYAASGHYIEAAKMILLAMVFDSVDGKVARMTNMASDFGSQLDSLSDVISFGVAPAFLTLSLCTSKEIIGKISAGAYMTLSASPMQPVKWIWMVSMLYALSAALRLARFNIESDEEVRSHDNFRGLPTPSAAGMIASLTLFAYEFRNDFGFDLFYIALWLLPVLTMSLGILMISRIRYAHVLNRAFKGQKPFTYLIEVVFIGILFAIKPELFLLIIFTVYLFSGIWTAAVERLYGQIGREETIF